MTIPFALSFAIGLMVLPGESANLLSVGAIRRAARSKPRKRAWAWRTINWNSDR
ncbi:MAG TPA: hypothetical protein VGL34_18140 [Steroidobacteraceae bacterium]